jgi:flagellar basal-body rod modification protein FlgD
MTVNSTTSAGASNATSAADAGRVPKQTLGQDDFLKLITVQLTKQDPMKPVDDTSFMAQMAQFTSLEQASGMARDMAAMRADSSLQSATAMLGREATLNTPDGPVTGVVSAVDTSDGTARINIGGTLYTLNQVTRVAPAPVAATS